MEEEGSSLPWYVGTRNIISCGPVTFSVHANRLSGNLSLTWKIQERFASTKCMIYHQSSSSSYSNREEGSPSMSKQDEQEEGRYDMEGR
jgi:hypothetical protein